MWVPVLFVALVSPQMNIIVQHLIEQSSTISETGETGSPFPLTIRFISSLMPQIRTSLRRAISTGWQMSKLNITLDDWGDVISTKIP